jgi:hypothetical protein
MQHALRFERDRVWDIFAHCHDHIEIWKHTERSVQRDCEKVNPLSSQANLLASLLPFLADSRRPVRVFITSRCSRKETRLGRVHVLHLTKEVHATVARRRSESVVLGPHNDHQLFRMLCEIIDRRTARNECCTGPRAFERMNLARDDTTARFTGIVCFRSRRYVARAPL